MNLSKLLFQLSKAGCAAKETMLLLTVLITGITGHVTGQDLSQQNEIFWHTNTNRGITWDLTKENRLPHDDNLEMSGSMVSGIIGYKVSKEKQVEITRDIIFPQLRKYSKSNESMYRAYLRSQYKDEVLPVITIGEKRYETGVLDSIRIN